MGTQADRMIKTFLDAQNSLLNDSKWQNFVASASTSPMLDGMKSVLEKSAIQRMLEDINRNERMMRLAVGPLEDVRIFNQYSVLARGLEQIRTAEIVDRFRVPDISETHRLLNEFQVSPGMEALKRYAENITGLERALQSMRTPWLDVQDSMRSIGGLAALQGIGHALENMSTFGNELSSALRSDLGDWRDTISWPEEIFVDLGARANFYERLGFNSTLTDFPSSAFEESLSIAGLQREPPSLINLYALPIPPSVDDGDEEVLELTNLAHDWLLRLETQLRRFIDQQMTMAFGCDWPRNRLPNGLYDKWQEKKRKANESANKQLPLIAYADFTDYVDVICKRDNWVVFSKFFVRKEDIREAFQRLHPIRLDTMHARPITHDDTLLLVVETKRLMRVMIRRIS